MAFGRSIAGGLTGLLRFSGRDRPGRFWPYAGAILLTNLGVSMIGFVALLSGTFAKIQKFVAEHPDQVTEIRGPGSYSVQINGYHPELMPDFGAITGYVAMAAVVMVALLAAAVTRRLHDSGMAGWPGLLPVVLLGAGLARMQSLFALLVGPGEPDMQQIAGLFLTAFLINLFYLASLGWLLYLLIRKGTPEANRYGEPPASD
jgi:uncharacterized membrane protein YhaH (DUF805 family)